MKALLLLSACGLAALAAEIKLGKPLLLDHAMPIPEVLANKDKLLGKTVQVKGRITEVCQMAGCWTQITDPETNLSIRVKVNDGEIEFPKTSVGKAVTAEGRLVRLTLTGDQAAARDKHEAEEQGRKYKQPRLMTGRILYQILGSGAVIEN